MEKKGKKVRILQLKELKMPVREEKMRHSVEVAKDSDDGTEMAEAQETLINLILNLGGVREDVFEYLMTPHFRNAEAVASIGRLLCYAAPVEWIMLSVQALERMAGAMYVNEITESYQAGLPLDQVQYFLEKSETVFEMCQCRLQYTKTELADRMTGSKEEETGNKMTGSEGKELADNVTGSEKVENGNGMSYDNLAKIVTAAVISAMQKSSTVIASDTKGELADRMTGSKEEETGNKMTESERGELADNVTGSERGKLADNVTGSEKKELADNVTGSKKTGKTNTMEKRDWGDVPDFPDGEEIQDNRILVKELKEAEEQAGKRISFFQILLNRHMKKAFSKLDAEAQESKIFEIMVEKKYGKEKILSIRRLMKGGMSNEFIFSLLEKDLHEEELKELCETLLADDITGKNGTEDEEEEEV